MDILESAFQRRLIKRIKKDLPGCIVLKNDPNYLQGFPDLLILYGPRWAAVEVKRSPDADHQPNQDYYVDRLNRMSYAAFINPENERKIRNDIYQALGAGGNARVPESKQQRMDELFRGETRSKISELKSRANGNRTAPVCVRRNSA